MSNNRLPLLVIILVVLAAIGFGAYYFFGQQQTQNGVLTASGTVEATQVSIAPELSGKVAEVLVDEGDTVKAGDVLFRIDDTLLKAQRDVAAAGLETAKAATVTTQAAAATAQIQYDTAYKAAVIQTRSTRISGWYNNQPGEFTLPLWYYDQTEQVNSAQAEVDAAQAALKDFQDKLTAVQARSAGADFVQAEKTLSDAQAAYQVAKSLHDRVSNGTNMDDLTRRQLFLLARDNYLQSKGVDSKWVTLTASVNKDLRDAAQELYDDAKQNLDDAQSAYDDAASTDGAQDVRKARAQVSMAQERYYTALDFLDTLQTGADSPAVTAAHKVLEQAQAAAQQASTAVGQAQANLTLLDAQMGKLTVTAPSDGIIITRSVEPGEVVNPGSVVFSLAQLQSLTLTVYIPEDRYGEVALGQSVSVAVDSFPGETFAATVIHIADQAEFTPRNVQTVEGRKTTVFAVKLSLQDPQGKLKPGMPADVTFK